MIDFNIKNIGSTYRSLNALIAKPQNFRFGVSTTTQLTYITTKSGSNDFQQCTSQLTNVPVLSKVIIIFFSYQIWVVLLFHSVRDTCHLTLIYIITLFERGMSSSVGIATDYGLDAPGSNPGGEEICALRTGPGAHPASCKMCIGSFPVVKCGRGVLLTTHPLSYAAVMEE